MSILYDQEYQVGEVEAAADAALQWLADGQTAEGFWVGIVESNSTIEAEWLIASHITGLELPNEPKIIATLLHRQRADGSWGVYPGAPKGDKNSTIEVYAALRVKGFDPDHPALAAARNWIRRNGGMTNVRVFTRYWLAMIGVWPWVNTPSLPPEIIRLPLWFPFNIYNFAQWARATIVPLAVLSARRPVWPLHDGSRLEELFLDGYDNFDFGVPLKRAPLISLSNLFQWIDRGLHVLQSLKITPMREGSVTRCLEWMIRHQDADGAWGGIQPPWIYGLIALVNEGYALDHPVVAKAHGALAEHWSYERDGGVHIQATESPVWDTLLSLLAMHEAGCDAEKEPAMRRALEWVLDKQVLNSGDWALRSTAPPGGWAFERANRSYPDVDDTAVALLVLAKVRPSAGALRPHIVAAIERGVAWTLGMQSRSGGWGAFDKDNDKSIILTSPFCSYGEALDPASVDVTGHVVEALGALGYRLSDPVVSRAVAFILAEQEKDGSWFGRWGVNHIYGTAAVLPALRAVGFDMSQPAACRAADWIIAHQNPDGGWGESCASYMDPNLRGVGPSTPSQTAWGIMSLQAMDSAEYSAAIDAGLRYLTQTQTADGTWDESFYTGTGFPGYGTGLRSQLSAEEMARAFGQGTELSRGFMLGYNMYRHYFPLIAIGRSLNDRR